MQSGEVQHVFLVGAKSLGAYGGYETFINKLTEYHQNNPKIQYHVACKSNGDGSMNLFLFSSFMIIKDISSNQRSLYFLPVRKIIFILHLPLICLKDYFNRRINEPLTKRRLFFAIRLFVV